MSCERVLVVDDERAVRETVAETLKREGFEVAEAADWREVSTTVRGAWGDFDAVVMDIGLPGVGGIDLARFIGNARPAPAVVYHSGRTDLATAAVRSGGHPFVPKGTDPAALVATVRRIVDERRRTRETT